MDRVDTSMLPIPQVDPNTFHVVLTRFNVRRGAAPDPRVLSVEWLDKRLEIFKSVTVPSVAAQTRRPDIWLVFLDQHTPLPIRAALQQMTEALPLLRPIYCGVLDAAVYTDVIRRMAPAGRNWLVTTRLDNDDALHPSLLDAVQRAAAQRKREFINPQRGLIVASGLLYRKRDSSSPFISYSEPLAECRTVWMDQHQRLGRHGTIRQLKLPDAWVQYVHGGNIANQVRGWRTMPQQVDLAMLPPALHQSLRPVGWWAYAAANSVGLVKRYAGSVWRRLRREWADRRSQ